MTWARPRRLFYDFLSPQMAAPPRSTLAPLFAVLLAFACSLVGSDGHTMERIASPAVLVAPGTGDVVAVGTGKCAPRAKSTATGGTAELRGAAKPGTLISIKKWNTRPRSAAWRLS
jgi:hypothetical protein